MALSKRIFMRFLRAFLVCHLSVLFFGLLCCGALPVASAKAVLPQLTSFAPKHGYAPLNATKGTVVTITGTNFWGVTDVRFNTRSAGPRVGDVAQIGSGFQIVSDTTIKVFVPADAVTGKLSLASAAGFVNSIEDFVVAPRIIYFTPEIGSAGNIVTIFGFNMGPIAKVNFGAVAAGGKVSDITVVTQGFQVVTIYQVKVRVPSDAPSGKITLFNNFGDNVSTTNFRVVPSITNLAPTHGYATQTNQNSTIVTITGSDFLSASAIRFNGISSGPRVSNIDAASAGFQVLSSTKIKARVPLGASTGKVSVVTPAGTFNGEQIFTVAPSVTSFAPPTGQAGSVVVFSGFNFSAVSKVQFGGISVENKVDDLDKSESGFQVSSNYQIKVRVPAKAKTGKITIFNNVGDFARTSTDFKVLPSLDNLTPEHGYAAGSDKATTIVTISGNILSGVSDVQFNGVSAGPKVGTITAALRGYQIVSDTQLKALVPANATTGKVSVVTTLGTFASPQDFVVAPRLSSFTPSIGSVGTIVLIDGFNLGNTANVQFGDKSVGAKVDDINTSANGFQIVGDNRLKVRVPLEASTGSISVFNSLGDSATTKTVFTVLPPPDLINLSPDHGFAALNGLPGTVVTLSGTGLSSATAVLFNGVAAGTRTANTATAPTGFQIVDDNQIQVIVPANASSGLVSVVTDRGVTQSINSFFVELRETNLKMPAMFSDNMVLQQGVPVPFWGQARAGQTVTVSFAGQSKETVADGTGNWKLQLAPLPVVESETLTVRSDTEITFRNVAVGEVWLCAGQSNMAFVLAEAQNGQAEADAANDSGLRCFTVTPAVAQQPQTDVAGHWFLTDSYSARNFSAVAYFLARELRRELHIPVGLIVSAYPASTAEAWTTEATLQADADFQPILQRWENLIEANPAQANSPLRPANLYNAMLLPLAPYAVRGVAWYQGEGNIARAYQYRKLLPAMMNDWRQLWGVDSARYPFHVVQLPNYGAAKTEPGDSTWAELREAQTLATSPLSVTGDGLAVTIDIGEGLLHPTNKLDVGLRLARVALAKTYGKSIEYTGPFFDSMQIEGSEIRLKFTHAAGLSTTAIDANALPGFAIAGADRVWMWANARIEGNDVVVSNSGISNPVAVRYAWANNPQATLYNSAGLPAVPFRTDDWPGLTDTAR